MVGLVGLEPTTPALSRRCSNQLSYRPKPVAWPPQTQDEFRIAGDILPTTDKCERLNLRASDLDHFPPNAALGKPSDNTQRCGHFPERR